jgi:predicted metal-dependent hydrolase
VSKKSGPIAARIAQFQGQELDAHYLGYFDCFNRQLFYEAHDVLEELWLANRRGPDGDFCKGLIQLAGAFVHIQKNRRGPAGALFRLACANLQKYPPRHQQLDVRAALTLTEDWSTRLDGVSEVRALLSEAAPSLSPTPASIGAGTAALNPSFTGPPSDPAGP